MAMTNVTRSLLGSAAALKPLSEQIILLTGVTEGIGESVARKAAIQGATLVIADTDGIRLEQLARQLGTEGAKVWPVVLQGSDEPDLQQLGKSILERFGRLDSWIANLSGVLCQHPGSDGSMSTDDLENAARSLLVHARLAHEYLAETGGACITVAIPETSANLPVATGSLLDKLGTLCCAMRAEADQHQRPYSLALIRPAPADGNAGRLQHDGEAEPAVCPCEAVAAAALYAAQHPAREIYVGMAVSGTVPPLHYTPCANSTNILHLAVPGQRKRRADRLLR